MPARVSAMGRRSASGLAGLVSLGLLAASCNIGGPAGFAPSPALTAPAAQGAPASQETTPAPSATTSAGPTDLTISVARYADGIPESVGSRPVLRGTVALAAAAAAADSRTFYVGGWVSWWPGVRFCPLAANDGNWLHDCPAPTAADQAGATDSKLDAAITFRFVLAGLHTGPFVAQVHVHDPRAGGCGSAASICDGMMVVDRIVWSGDDGTRPRPFTAASIEHVINVLDAGADITQLVPPASLTDCGDVLSSASLFVPTHVPASGPIVTLAELEPSAAAALLAKPQATGLAGAIERSSVACTSYWTSPTGSGSAQWRWMVVANAAVLVRTDIGLSSRDRAFLQRLAEALTSAARG